MKTTHIILATALIASSALAPTACADNSAYDWSGLYAGVYAGYGDASGDNLDLYDVNFGDTADPTRADLDGNGLVFGGLLGANKQFDGGLVLGLEADFGLSPSAKGLVGNNFFGPYDDSNAKIDPIFNSSARARLGFAMDRVMPFMTAGIGYMSFDSKNRGNFDCNEGFCAGNGAFNGSGNFVGWTAGAGVNYAMTDHVVLGLEYRYTDFGSTDLGLVGPAGSGETRTVRADLQQHDVRASLAFKF
jgi:outer membrane immunogenic protein